MGPEDIILTNENPPCIGNTFLGGESAGLWESSEDFKLLGEKGFRPTLVVKDQKGTIPCMYERRSLKMNRTDPIEKSIYLVMWNA